MAIRSEAADNERASKRLFMGVLVATTVAKVALVLMAPDVEVDAYLHAWRGRRMWLDPTDLGVHWVWLPNLHALYAATTALELPMNAVRLFAAAASSITPIVVQRGLSASLASRPPVPRFATIEAHLPWVAGSMLALEPLSFSMGHSGLTEAFFQCAVWSGTFAFARASFVFAGSAFAVAAGFRYEAWALVPVVFTLALLERDRWRRASWTWLLPTAVVIGWCLALRRSTGEWLPFLTPNRQFVNDYFAERGYLWGREPNRLAMLLWYAVIVPFGRMLGPLLALVVASGTWWRARAPRAVIPVGTALLAFLTVGFLAGGHLGLVRHATSLAPLYVIGAAAGAGVAGRWAHGRFREFSGDSEERVVRRWMVVGVGALAVLGTLPIVAIRVHGRNTNHASERAAAAALRRAFAPGDAVVCDDIPTEVLSALPPSAFVRARIEPTAAASGPAPATRRVLAVVPRAPADRLGADWSPVWQDDELAVKVRAP